MFVSAMFNKFDNIKLIKETVEKTTFEFIGLGLFSIITEKSNYLLLWETHKGGIYYCAQYKLPFFNISFSDITFFLDRVIK